MRSDCYAGIATGMTWNRSYKNDLPEQAKEILAMLRRAINTFQS